METNTTSNATEVTHSVSSTKELKLSRCSGDHTNTKLEPWTSSFSELCNAFQTAIEGDKAGSYFVRGPVDSTNPHRADRNIPTSSAIVLDGDRRVDPGTGEVLEGAPPPEEVHEALKALGINHCLYTTHSHNPANNYNRFRIVIPAEAQNKEELTAYLRWIFYLLEEKGCWLADVKENYVWSQPWNLPRISSADAPYVCLYHDTSPPFDQKAALAWIESQQVLPVEIPQKTVALPFSRQADSEEAAYTGQHNSAHWILKTLKQHGYEQKSTSMMNGCKSYRLLSPISTSGSPGIVVFCSDDGIWRVYSHHSENEPLSRADEPGSASDAFDVYRILEHGGNRKQATSAIQRDNDSRPLIKAKPGNIPGTLKEIVDAVATTSPPAVYQRAQSLCRVAHMNETTEAEGCTIPKGTAQIIVLQRAGLAVELSRAARWERKQKSGGWQVCDPSPVIVAAMLEGVGFWDGIPSLLGLSEAPILREDGSLFAEPGYDRHTGLYVEGSFPKIVVPEDVSKKQALAASKRLFEPFCEFPFVDDDLDRAVLLAYLITLAVRPQLTIAPLFCVSATTPGTGKGLLIEASNRLVRGRDAATMPPVQGGSGEEETRKRITALLSRGVASINLDNWTKPIGGESMNTLLTTTEWTDRILGGSRTVSLPNRITLAATGNNLGVRGDMTRRSLLLQLDAKTERPEQRPIEVKDLLGLIERDREKLLTALFTILKGFQDAGRPGQNKHLLGRFEAWSAAVAAPIRWLGLPDPVDSQERLRDQDPEGDKLELFLAAWHGVHGEKWLTAGELTDALANGSISGSQRSGNSLHESILDIASDSRGYPSNKLLGWYLRHNNGRIAAGYRLEQKPRSSTKSKHAKQYRVTKLQHS